jgi:hypothetical protein
MATPQNVTKCCFNRWEMYLQVLWCKNTKINPIYSRGFLQQATDGKSSPGKGIHINSALK